MRRHFEYEYSQLIRLDLIDKSILQAEARGTVSLPFTSKSFVVKTLDLPESCRARDFDDVFPFLVSLQYFVRESRKPPDDTPMFIDLPHTTNILYYIWYVNTQEAV
jgi:hypothetical protein